MGGVIKNSTKNIPHFQRTVLTGCGRRAPSAIRVHACADTYVAFLFGDS